ncbi:hypothetical protein HRbin30_01520 [bacterium HR30]|nr:hypothetical protein HRbin30_01520 [bacterium HR30]
MLGTCNQSVSSYCDRGAKQVRPVRCSRCERGGFQDVSGPTTRRLDEHVGSTDVFLGPAGFEGCTGNDNIAISRYRPSQLIESLPIGGNQAGVGTRRAYPTAWRLDEEVHGSRKVTIPNCSIRSPHSNRVPKQSHSMAEAIPSGTRRWLNNRVFGKRARPPRERLFEHVNCPRAASDRKIMGCTHDNCVSLNVDR